MAKALEAPNLRSTKIVHLKERIKLKGVRGEVEDMMQSSLLHACEIAQWKNKLGLITVQWNRSEVVREHTYLGSGSAKVALTLEAFLVLVSLHWTSRSLGPIMKPKCLALGTIFQSRHSGMCVASQVLMKLESCVERSSLVGISLHLGGLSWRLATSLANLKTQNTFSTQYAPMSSAHALTTPVWALERVTSNV